MDEPFDFDDAASGSGKKKAKAKFKWWWVLAAGVGAYGTYYLYEKYEADKAATAAASGNTSTEPSDSNPADVPGGGTVTPTDTTGAIDPITGDPAGSASDIAALQSDLGITPAGPQTPSSTVDQNDFVAGAVSGVLAQRPSANPEDVNNVVNDILNGEPVPFKDRAIAAAYASWLNQGGYALMDQAGLTSGSITVASHGGGNTTSSTPGSGGSTDPLVHPTETANKIVTGETGELPGAPTNDSSLGPTSVAGEKSTSSTKSTSAAAKQTFKKIKDSLPVIGISPLKKVEALPIAGVSSEKAIATAKKEGETTSELERNVIKPPAKAVNQIKSAAKVTNPLDFTAISDKNAPKPSVVSKEVAPKPAPKPVAKKK